MARASSGTGARGRRSCCSDAAGSRGGRRAFDAAQADDRLGVEPDKELEEAIQLIARHQVRRLPVIENSRLVGIVAQADIALREIEKTGELVEAISEPSEGERS